MESRFCHPIKEVYSGMWKSIFIEGLSIFLIKYIVLEEMDEDMGKHPVAWIFGSFASSCTSYVTLTDPRN